MNAPAEVLVALDAAIEEMQLGGLPGTSDLQAARVVVAELIEAMRLQQRMNREALGKFNWGASALDANAIDLLNRAPAAVDTALARVGGAS